MERKKVIFLDYDGVVNTPDAQGFINYPDAGLVNNSYAVSLISKFCLKYRYSLVITSTWNIYENYKDFLVNGGLESGVFILGRTEQHCCERPDAITKYLEKHPEIEKYLVFDDIADMGIHSKFHVCPNFEKGFNEICYMKAVRLHKLYNENEEKE